MPEQTPAERDEPTADEPSAAESKSAARKRKLDQIFGDVLPDATRDERGNGTPGPAGGTSSRDEELRRDVPPHHGG